MHLRLTHSTLLFIASLQLLPSSAQAIAPISINGSVAQPIEAGLRVVAFSRTGQVVDSAAVTNHGVFALYSIPHHDGDYSLQLQQSQFNEYHHIHIHIANRKLLHAQIRSNILVPPHTPLLDSEPRDPIELRFVPHVKANYLRLSPPWRLRNLWNYKMRFIQFAAIAFVLWFPQVLKSMDKETREEITGKKEVDFGDPNKHIKALILFEEPTNGAAAPSPS